MKFFKLFEHFKKKEPVRTGGLVDAMNALGAAFKMSGENILYGVPISQKQPDQILDTKKIIKVFILYTDISTYERNEIDKIKKQLNHVCSVLINDTSFVFSYITKNTENSIHEALSSDIIVDTCSCGNKAKAFKTLLDAANKSFIDADKLQEVFLFMKKFTDLSRK